MPSRCASTGTRASACTRATRLLPPRGTIMSIGPARAASRRPRRGPASAPVAPLRRASPAATSPLDQRGMDRAVAMHRLAAAAQQHRIARTQTQRGGIGGHVGAAFIDDPDQPDGNAHASRTRPLGRLSGRSPRRPDRAARRPDRPHRQSRQPRRIEPQPVEHGRGQPALGACRHIERIGVEYAGLAPATRGRSQQSAGFIRGKRRQSCGGAARAPDRQSKLDIFVAIPVPKQGKPKTKAPRNRLIPKNRSGPVNLNIYVIYIFLIPIYLH